MPKRKPNDSKMLLKDKGCQTCQTEEIEIVEEDFFEDETNHYLLLELIANDLESSNIISESVDGDQIDDFREAIKFLVEKLFEQIKNSIKNDAARPDNKKQKFIKALIRIFPILLNANLSSAKKITKIINHFAKLVIKLERTVQQFLCLDHREDQTSESLEPETNHRKEN